MERAYRLRRSSDVQEVFASGQAYRNEHFVVLVLPSDALCLRFAIITGRRLGKAAVRNRLRRLIRESLRWLRPRMKLGYDVVIIARQSTKNLSFEHVRQSLAAVLAQAGLLVG